MIVDVVSIITKVKQISGFDKQILEQIGILTMEVQGSKVQVLFWRKPAGSKIKLNVYGCHYGNPYPCGVVEVW